LQQKTGMGSKSSSQRGKQITRKKEQEALSLLSGESLESLKEDWCLVKNIPFKRQGIVVVPQTDITKTSINQLEFKKLMSSDMTESDLAALFALYDYDHDGTITWREYICVITLLMTGNTEEKVRLVFNCFDDDGNGVLDKNEFKLAATRFSSQKDDIESFCNRVFAACDKNGDGQVSYREFYDWVTHNQEEFEKFAGVLNILPEAT